MKISKLYLLFSTIWCFSSELSFAMQNPCDIELTTESEAMSCLNWKLTNEKLYNKAAKDGHLGDMGKCTTLTSKESKSYFSDNSPTFYNTIQNTTPYKCIYNDKSWACWGRTTGSQPCYIASDEKTKGRTTDNIFFAIGDGQISTKIITFRPDQ